MRRKSWLVILSALLALPCFGWAGRGNLSFVTTSHQAAPRDNDRPKAVHQRLEWNPNETAVLVFDVWDRHWCRSATERVNLLAPHINRLLQILRKRGVFVIHCPSETMSAYAGTPQRHRAQQAPRQEAAEAWTSSNSMTGIQLPIDDADGGCEDDPPCRQGGVWHREHPDIEMAEPDAVTDQGEEVQNLLEQYKIRNVLVVGVHANMCLLNRAFSIPVLVKAGKRVVLVRDLTDVMYNPKRRPFVGHLQALDLVVGFIESQWCPSTTSSDLVGGHPFKLPR